MTDETRRKYQEWIAKGDVIKAERAKRKAAKAKAKAKARARGRGELGWLHALLLLDILDEVQKKL